MSIDPPPTCRADKGANNGAKTIELERTDTQARTRPVSLSIIATVCHLPYCFSINHLVVLRVQSSFREQISSSGGRALSRLSHSNSSLRSNSRDCRILWNDSRMRRGEASGNEVQRASCDRFRIWHRGNCMSPDLAGCADINGKPEFK